MTSDFAQMPPYLPSARSGVAYLLDPSDPGLPGLVHDRQERTADSPCDPDAVAADLHLLPRLLQDRHFGVATGLVPVAARDAAFAAISRAAERVVREQPRTWGTALGDLCDQLRTTLVDRHIHIAGAPRSAIRAGEPCIRNDDGPAVQIEVAHEVLTVRIRTLVGEGRDGAALEAWVADAKEHFRHRKILVDLRGNTRGDGGYTADWMEAAEPASANVASDQGWTIRDSPLNLWNATVVAGLISSASDRQLGALTEPRPGDRIVLRGEPHGELSGARTSAAWDGEMLVLTDSRTGSSGESSAWYLREGLGAVVAGGPTYGSIEYGNIAPYCLPHGLWVGLATKHNRFPVPVELVGLQPDLAIDPTHPTAYYADRFDDIFSRAARRRRESGSRCRAENSCGS